MVFPNKVVSQTIVSYDQQAITNPSAVYSTADPQTIKQAEIQEQLAAKAQIFGYCSCVTFAKRLTGYDESVGAAKNWPINTFLPQVGDVVVLKEGSVGHVAVITAVNGTNITLVEANYVFCEKSERTINLNDPDILGFWENNI